MTLNDIAPDCCDRLEEVPSSPVFWSLINEIYPQIADGMFEAALLTGTVQAPSQPFTITADTNYFTNPKGFIAPLRLRAPYPIKKVTLAGLDEMTPGWQQATPGSQIQAWWPLGVSGFGIYPALAVEATVIIDWIVSPVNQPRPYSATTPVPFAEQFTDGLSQYGAFSCRNKEGGQEAQEGETVYQEYLSRMKSLSLWQARLDALVLSGAFGGQVQTNPRAVV